MMDKRKLAFWALGIASVGILSAGTVIGIRLYREYRLPVTIKGAIIKQDYDTRKQSPIANVQIVFLDGSAVQEAKSDFSGAFSLKMRRGLKRGRPIHLAFYHSDFKPLELNTALTSELYIVRMIPLHSDVEANSNGPSIKVTNVLVRYTTETMRTENIGSAVKTFQVLNSGNVPCNGRIPCSPDGKWKAQTGSTSLDAGQGNVFRDPRITCIAGPCPFTRIAEDNFSAGGRTISVSMLDWSDTATFLVQAEVFRSQLENIVRRAYPVIFGRSLNFALPSTAEGPSIEADIDGTTIVFPLGPTPILSWATCQVRVEKNQARDYRCELKAGYEFR
jgi:hypothetical protein